MATLDRSRLGVAAQALGIAQGATDYAAALRPRAQAVRQADQLLSGDPVQARRHGDAVRGRARAALPGVRQDRPRRRRPRQVLGDGEAVLLRRRDDGHRRGRAGAGRLRLRQGVSGRADDARREDHPDLRGHERDPAPRDRPDPAGSARVRAAADHPPHPALGPGGADRRPGGGQLVRRASATRSRAAAPGSRGVRGRAP